MAEPGMPGEKSATGEPNPSATIDAIHLMLRDLHTRHDEIRHRAAFRGCTKELLALQQELVDYLLAKKNSLSGTAPARNGSGLNYNSFT
ncbi:MAG: hypothetical protein ACKO5F_08105 [Synechococcus sp.]